jgi:hypothetical protein
MENIEAGFRRTGIHPLNPSAMELHMGPLSGCAEVQGEGNMGPSGASTHVHGEGHGLELPSQEAAEGFPAVTIEVLSEPADIPCSNTQYLMDLGESKGEDELQLLSSQMFQVARKPKYHKYFWNPHASYCPSP